VRDLPRQLSREELSELFEGDTALVALAREMRGKMIERARDLLQRDFTATALNEKWVCDLTYIRTWNDD